MGTKRFQAHPRTMVNFMITESEAEFQTRVTELAEDLGWEWLHVATTGIGRHSPMRGPLGKGWPDLVLIRRGTILFVELKGQKGQLSVEQHRVLSVLASAARAEVWRPQGWDQIIERLTNA